MFVKTKRNPICEVPFCCNNTIIYLVSFYIFLRLPEAPDTVWDQYHHPYVLDRDTQIDFIKFIAAEAQ